MPPHLVQPCFVALGWALIWGLYPDEFEGFNVVSHHFCLSLSLFINRYMNSDKLFIMQAINIVTPSGIQTWIFSLQLCLNIVDNLSCSATTAGLQWKVIIETNIGTKFVVYYNHLVRWSNTCFFTFSNIFPLLALF